MTRLIARTSTIFIASGDATQVYSSITDVPPPLLRKLQDSTAGVNSATILIADRHGREELVRAMQRQPSAAGLLLADIKRHEIEAAPSRKLRRLPGLRTWAELLLPVLVGASLWLLIDSHF